MAGDSSRATDAQVSVFVSAVSDEFHKHEYPNPLSFRSYRDILSRSLRILVRDCRVVAQEDLVQGPGDLLDTLEREICECHVVVHLLGQMSGWEPTSAELRKLRGRNPRWLEHEPELATHIGEGTGISYTQWEAYLAFQHRCDRLVFVVDEKAPRSPRFRRDEPQLASQQKHRDRLESTSEHYETCFDQLDLSRKVVASIERFGLRPPGEPQASPGQGAAADRGAGMALAIGTAIRSSAKTAITEFDPAGIQAFLEAIDTVALQQELDRRQVLQAVHGYREKLLERVHEAPTPETLYDLALAELALGHYVEAMLVAERLANEQHSLIDSDPENLEKRRQNTQNAYLLLHEAAHLSGRRDAAISALQRSAALVDKENDPIFWADLNEVLAKYLLDSAMYKQAEPIIDDVLDIREEHQGDSDPALPKTLLVWANLLYYKASYRGSVDVAARAATLFSNQTPPAATNIAAAFNLQSLALMKLGDRREAEPLIRSALAIFDQTFGPDHPDVAASLDNLALLLQETNRLAEAEPLMWRALAIQKKAYGLDHPDIARSLNNLASLLKETNRLAEAELLMKRALTIFEQTYGTDHPDVATSLNNLAVVLKETNRLAEAEPLMKRALTIFEQIYGPDHPNVATSLNNLAMLLKGTNRLAEAEPLMRRALAIQKKAYGLDHPDVATSLNNLASLLQETNRLAEAEPLMRRRLALLATHTRRTGHQHPQLNAAMANYRSLLLAMGFEEMDIRKRLATLTGENCETQG